MKHSISIHGFIFLSLFFLINQTSNAQSFNWAKAWGSTASDENTASVVKGGFIYNTGYFTGTCDFDPGPGTANRVCVGVWDIYVSKSDTSGNLIWVATFGSNDEDKGSAIAVDDSGFVYATGFFKGTVDFDPGSGTVNRTSKGAADIYVIRLDPTGNLSWIATNGASSEDRPKSICLDTNRNVYTTGSFYSTVDFDPGSATYNLSSRGGQDVFIQKLSPYGNFIGAVRIGDWAEDYATSISSDAKNLYLTGWFSGSVDMDPGQDTIRLVSKAYDPFVVKLDFNFDAKWAVNFGSNTGEGGEKICVDNSYNVISAGYFQSTADFDPGLGKFNINSKGGEDIYIQKLDSNGRFLWAKAIGTSGIESVSYINTDESGNIYVVGQYKGTIDMDPGPGVFNLNSGTRMHAFILKLDRAGNFIWAKSIGSSLGEAKANFISADIDKFLYVSGYFSQTTDFDPGSSTKNVSSNSNSADAFMFKWGQDKCSDMAIVFDSFFNYVCDTVGKIFARGMHGKKPYTYEWNTNPVSYDTVLEVNSKGFYGLTIKDSNLCSRSTSILIGGPDTLQGFDVTSTLVHTPLRTGFKAYVFLDVFNELCAPASGEVKLLLNKDVIYDSADIAPVRVNGDTVVWAFSGLNYGANSLRPIVYLRTKTTAKFGDRACFKVLISPINGDRDTLNNIKEYCTRIVNAYDPNDKNIYPAGSCADAYILKDQPVEYRIRFQNTGNADAINIVITDTLSNLLDPSTMEIKSQSHPGLITELVQGNVVRFNFNGIHLPDSFTSPAGSQGYVVYVIQPKTGITDGSILKNRASIYFDYNPAVITNYTNNSLVSSIPFESSTVTKTACRSFEFDGRNLTQSGTYKANLLSTDGCDSIVNLTLNITSIDTSVVQNGSTLIIGQQGATYRWLNCNNGYQPVLGAVSRIIVFIKSGIYAAEITLNGCSDTTECYSVKGTGISDFSNNELIRIWPNPGQGIFNVDLSAFDGSCELRLFNSTGQMVKQMTSSSLQSVIELKAENGAGIYLLEIEHEGEVYRFKLLSN